MRAYVFVYTCDKRHTIATTGHILATQCESMMLDDSIAGDVRPFYDMDVLHNNQFLLGCCRRLVGKVWMI
jgi:hypothetical protein